MPAKKTAKRHQRRAAKLGGLRDIRDIFLALLEESALTRSCDSRSLEAARAHPKAFRLIYEITDAMRRDTPASRRLIFKLADVADKHRTSVDERRAQFVVSVERAATLTRTSVDRRHPAEMLALSIIAEIRLRRRLAGIVEPDDFGWPGTDGDPWPTDEIQAELEKLKPPNSARAIDRRGGRSAFGPDAVAASLSRRFALFGDRSSQSNEAVAEKFKAARRRVVTQLSKKKGDESSPP